LDLRPSRCAMHFVLSGLVLGSALRWVAGVCYDDCEKTGSNLLQSRATRIEPKYFWQSGRGNFPNFGVSEDSGPFLLNQTLKWSWHHPEGRFHTLTYGTAIDNQMNVYLSAADGLRKFSKDGKLLWEVNVLPANLMNAPAIYQGSVFTSDTHGGVRAVSMQTGKPVWFTNTSKSICQDNGFNMVHEGLVFSAGDCREPSVMGTANHLITALNATDGEIVWTYEPDVPVWNFLPLFPDKESLVFQDMSGKVYHLSLGGQVLWKNGGINGTWTDGGAALGNGMVYSVSNNHLVFDPKSLSEDGPGTLSAFNLQGQLQWQVTTPRPPNNAPAIGKVASWPGMTLIQPLCYQGMPGATCDVYAYNADTGALRWIFHGPKQPGRYQAGDREGIVDRMKSGLRSLCLPNGWSAPTISGDGTVFVGNEMGNLYALRDTDGDGRVFGDDEVSFYDTKGAFSGTATPALAGNMIAAASCDTLFVFKG